MSSWQSKAFAGCYLEVLLASAFHCAPKSSEVLEGLCILPDDNSMVSMRTRSSWPRLPSPRTAVNQGISPT